MRSTNPQILKNQILRCVTQSESTRVDRDRNPGSSPRARELDRAHIIRSTNPKIDVDGAHSLILFKSHCGAAAMRKDAGLTPPRATETTIYTTQVNMISVELGKSRGVRECSTVRGVFVELHSLDPT